MKKLQQFPIRIRRGTIKDIPSIETIAHQYPQELGFVRKVALRDAITRKNLLVAEYDNNFCGFVLYRSRKDGWFTIYDIGVHREYRGKGVGRFLVDAVPCPTRLKCTTDNTANEFYEKSHFALVRTEEGRKRPLNVWERRFLYVCCHGGSKATNTVCNQTHTAYGTRHNYTPHQQPFFVDIDWQEYDWLDYLLKIKLWKPVFAMVPDYEALGQRRGLYACIDDLYRAGVLYVGVCPKFTGAVKHIPPQCIVCVSVPTRYAGFLPDPKELKGRRLHLLGGSPVKQFKYIKEHPSLAIASGDMNAQERAAQFGTCFLSSTGKWKNKISEEQREGKEDTYLNRYIFSTEEIHKYIKEM